MQRTRLRSYFPLSRFPSSSRCRVTTGDCLLSPEWNVLQSAPYPNFRVGLLTICASLEQESFKLAKRIYVGNLPYDATEDQVRELFADYGTVESVVMINDRETGRFRGFCFVEMESAAAERAIEALDGEEFEGRPLKVNEARPREERGERRGGGGRGGQRGSRGPRDRNRDFPRDSRRDRR